jgi:hypothetical protein
MYNENEEDNNDKEPSLYNYNMMFNRIGNYNKDDDGIKIDISFINDIDLRNFNPKRYEYYTNLIKIYNEDPEILYNLLNKYNSIKYMKEREKKIIKTLYDYTKKSTVDVSDNDIKEENYNPSDWKEFLIKRLIHESKKNDSKKANTNDSDENNLDEVDFELYNNDRELKKKIDEIYKQLKVPDRDKLDLLTLDSISSKTNNLDMAILKGFKIAKILSELKMNGGKKIRGGTNFDDDALKAKYLNTQKYNNISEDDIKEYREEDTDRKSKIKVIKTNNKIEQLSNYIDIYNASDSDKQKSSIPIIKKIIRDFENDPKNPIEELALTFDDRIVFIIVTFFIRYVSLIMVQWCIDINIIKTFYEGFIYYAFIYIILFWFIVLFINIDNSYDVKYMNFNGIINSIRSLCYYFYMGTNGISRLLVHTSLILLLIIIPIILNIKKKSEFIDDEQKETVILNIEERKQLSKSLSLFTIFIWLFTSIIATKF